MGIFGEIMKGVRHSVEVNKAFFEDWYCDIPFVGEVIEMASEQRAKSEDWEEIRIAPGIAGRFGQSRAVEIGTLRAKLGIEPRGYSTKGFYVDKGRKAEAVALLRATGLDVE